MRRRALAVVFWVGWSGAVGAAGFGGVEPFGRSAAMAGAGLVSVGSAALRSSPAAGTAWIEGPVVALGAVSLYDEVYLPALAVALPDGDATVWVLGLRGMLMRPVEEVAGGVLTGRKVASAAAAFSLGWSAEVVENLGIMVRAEGRTGDGSVAAGVSGALLQRLAVGKRSEMRLSVAVRDVMMRFSGRGEEDAALVFGAGWGEEDVWEVGVEADAPWVSPFMAVLRAGGEVRLFRRLAVRSGVEGRGAVWTVSVGVGVELPVAGSVWAADAVWRPHPDLGGVFGVSVSWRMAAGEG